jgi:uncharacterized protein YxjI
MDSATLQTLTQFSVRQKLTMMVNRYEIAAPDGALVAVAQQKRMAWREQVTFYSDDSRKNAVFGFKARQRMDIGATYDVVDGNGAPIGTFRKDFARSLIRSTWHIDQPNVLEAVGRERRASVAVLRRTWEFVPFVSAVPFVIPYHFDFTTPDGRTVLSVVRRRSLRDSYEVTIQDAGLDRRLAAAMAVALDALQSR